MSGWKKHVDGKRRVDEAVHIISHPWDDADGADLRRWVPVVPVGTSVLDPVRWITNECQVRHRNLTASELWTTASPLRRRFIVHCPPVLLLSPSQAEQLLIGRILALVLAVLLGASDGSFIVARGFESWRVKTPGHHVPTSRACLDGRRGSRSCRDWKRTEGTSFTPYRRGWATTRSHRTQAWNMGVLYSVTRPRLVPLVQINWLFSNSKDHLTLKHNRVHHLNIYTKKYDQSSFPPRRRGAQSFLQGRLGSSPI